MYALYLACSLHLTSGSKPANQRKFTVTEQVQYLVISNKVSKSLSASDWIDTKDIKVS